MYVYKQRTCWWSSVHTHWVRKKKGIVIRFELIIHVNVLSTFIVTMTQIVKVREKRIGQFSFIIYMYQILIYYITPGPFDSRPPLLPMNCSQTSNDAEPVLLSPVFPSTLGVVI